MVILWIDYFVDSDYVCRQLITHQRPLPSTTTENRLICLLQNLLIDLNE